MMVHEAECAQLINTPPVSDYLTYVMMVGDSFTHIGEHHM